MTSRLLFLHFKMSRLALVAWALVLFILGTLSAFWIPEQQSLSPAHLPMPAVGSFVLYLIVYALIFSSGCLSNNQRDNMLLTLGTLPLRRRHTALGKSMFFALAVAGLAFIGSGSSVVAAEIVEMEINIGRLALLTAVGYLLVLTVYSYTLIGSAWCSNQRTALAIAAVPTFLAYLAEVIGSGYEGLNWLASISIFHYYDPSELLQEGTVDWMGLGILGGIIVGGHLAALFIFARRDLSV